MEYIRHKNLAQWLDDFPRSNPTWDEALAIFLCIASQICKGLQALYDCGIDANRDLKPGNIMVVKLRLSPNPKVHVKLIDMGTVKMSDGTLYTGDGTGMGTLFYGAPECWTDARTADSRADVFSLSAILWRMITHFARIELCREREIFYEYWDHGNQTCRFDDLWKHLITTLGKALPLYLSSRSNDNMNGVAARLQDIVIRGLNPEPAARPSFSEFQEELCALYGETRQETDFQIAEPQERSSRSRPHPILQDGTSTLPIDGVNRLGMNDERTAQAISQRAR